MNPTQSADWHLAQLRVLDFVLQALGHSTRLLEPSLRVPHPVLMLSLPQPGERPPLEWALSFYPVSADEVKHSLLLQYYTELPLTLDDDGLGRLRELLPALNNKTVLGHFGVTPGRNAVTYRYVQALPIAPPITQSDVADVILLAGYAPALFMELLEAVAAGRLSVADAMAQLT